MPSVLFAVDHIFRRTPDGTVYTMGGKFPYSAWKSYLEVFGSIRVIARGQPSSDVGSLSASSGKNVDFVLCSGDRGVSRFASVFADRRVVEREVDAADLVIARLPSELGLAACARARALGKPYLVEMVACPWDSLWNNGKVAARLYAPILWARTRRAAAGASVVRYVTASFLQQRYPAAGPTFVASNVQLSSSERPQIDRLALERNGKPIVFGTIGALQTRLKGIQTAIDALGRLKRERPDLIFTYRVLGEGDSARLGGEAKNAGIDGRVTFDGTRPAGDAVLEWLDEIDIYLQPSFQEGLPRAMIEALSRRCLAIGSTAGGIPELLPSERLHTPGDSRQLFRRILDVLDLDPIVADAERNRNFDVAKGYTVERLYESRIRSLEALHKLHMSCRKG